MGSWRTAGLETSAVCEVGWWVLGPDRPPVTWVPSEELPRSQSLASQSSWSACCVPSQLSLAFEASTIWPRPPFTATSHISVCQCPGLSPPHPHLCHLTPLVLTPVLPPSSKALHFCDLMAWTSWSLLYLISCFFQKPDMASIPIGLPRPPPLRGPGHFHPELLNLKPFPLCSYALQNTHQTICHILFYFVLCIGITYWLVYILFFY